MSSKLTLAKKLAKNRVQKGHTILTQTARAFVADIEEVPSPYFSPLQTRHQRKVNVKKQVVTPKRTPPFAETISQNEDSTQEAEVRQKVEKNDNVVTSTGKPQDWEKILENIRQMRESKPAPVDTMGCHECVDKYADAKTQRFHKLVALMLSSQTKDETTFAAMQRLKENTLTPLSISQMDPIKLQTLLAPVSFYKNKTKYMQQVAGILIDKYECDIPRSVKELVELPGVGPKMAHICMATAWNETTGIGVDVHVHRISNRLHWCTTKEPEKTRIALETWLPKELWREVNYLLVGFGQTICKPLRPNCSQCLNRDICPSAEKNGNKKCTAAGKKKVKTTKTQQEK